MRCHARLAAIFVGASSVLVAAVSPSVAQNALSFPSTETGKGQKCYFGECSDAPNAPAPDTGTANARQVPPAPTPSLPPPGTLGNLPPPPP